MSPSTDLQKSTDILVQGQPLVAVFFGSTSTIGQATLRVLAAAAAKGGQGYRAYLVGRNAEATQAIISDCQDLCPQGQFTFVKINDLSLIQDVAGACSEILRLEEETVNPRIDYLMLGQGGPIFKPRNDSKEGLDVTMSLMYYSRMKAITKLLPLLLKSTLPATVVSVYAAGSEQKIYPDDLSLRDLSHYTYSQARSHMVYMHTLFFESLAEKYPDKLRLIHIFPGLIVGPGFSSPELALWVRVTLHWFVLPLFGRWITTPAEECGRKMLSLISPDYPPRSTSQSKAAPEPITGTDGKPGSGVYSLGANTKSNYKAKPYEKFDKSEMRQKVWHHTTRAFEVIESGAVFTD
ncbi:putative Ketoreductase (KR) domain-containing protein [Seiridium cardinale]|uniref:Ketoreductase (KR) domain-containing protein n=1 Tax=Seiridium cardinale TaxID=138064 RepID=A0ABR2X7R3_9PEZI